MQSSQKKQEFYTAYVERNAEYEGVFFMGVKTTGVFCRPSCAARTPKFENCEFFEDAQDALLAGYRPCKKCQPMSLPNEESPLIKKLVAAVEQEPDKRWKDADFKALGVDSSTVRRQFKKRFGMTFVAYARARRMGMALKDIREGASVIEAQVSAGYESGSGFRDAFSRIIGKVPSKEPELVLKAEWIDTPIGAMLAIADDKGLYLLEFTSRRGLEREIERMRSKYKAVILPGGTPVIDQLKTELASYFKGDLKTFKTPLIYCGTAFQGQVWDALQEIPYGSTRSYAEQAEHIGNPNAVRAVARANGCNQIAIIIPCHRVIGSDGSLTGYAGGLARKEWLLAHERKHKSS